MPRRRPDRSSPRSCGSGCSRAAARRRPSSRRWRSAATSPMQSAAKPTGRPSSSATAAATGRSEFASSGPPFGRPKWASRITLPPLSEISRMVGSTRSMRVASLTLPFSIGHVEIDAQQHAFAFDVGGVEGAEVLGHGWVAFESAKTIAGPGDPRRHESDGELPEQSGASQVAFDRGDLRRQIGLTFAATSLSASASARLRSLERLIDAIDLRLRYGRALIFERGDTRPPASGSSGPLRPLLSDAGTDTSFVMSSSRRPSVIDRLRGLPKLRAQMLLDMTATRAGERQRPVDCSSATPESPSMKVCPRCRKHM